MGREPEFSRWLEAQDPRIGRACRRMARSGYPMAFIADWLGGETARWFHQVTIWRALAPYSASDCRVSYAEAWWRENRAARRWLALACRDGWTLEDLELQMRRRYPEGWVGLRTLPDLLRRLGLSRRAASARRHLCRAG